DENDRLARKAHGFDAAGLHLVAAADRIPVIGIEPPAPKIPPGLRGLRRRDQVKSWRCGHVGPSRSENAKAAKPFPLQLVGGQPAWPQPDVVDLAGATGGRSLGALTLGVGWAGRGAGPLCTGGASGGLQPASSAGNDSPEVTASAKMVIRIVLPFTVRR